MLMGRQKVYAALRRSFDSNAECLYELWQDDVVVILRLLLTDDWKKGERKIPG